MLYYLGNVKYWQHGMEICLLWSWMDIKRPDVFRFQFSSNIKCFIDGEKFSHFGRDISKWFQTEHIHWSCGDQAHQSCARLSHRATSYHGSCRIMSDCQPAPPHLMLWHRGHNHNNLASPQHATWPPIGRWPGGCALIGCWPGGTHLCAGWWACVEDTEPVFCCNTDS